MQKEKPLEYGVDGDGKSVEAVRDAVAKLMPEMPVEGVYPLVTLDSGDFR